MNWATLKYSKSQVDKAGVFLTTTYTEEGHAKAAEYLKKLNESFDVLNNWRATHAFPLNSMQMLLRRMAKSVDKNALVAQRLKRVESILTKLIRFPQMNLSRMQDIGGCRAVVGTVGAVKEIQGKYLKSRTKHEPCPDHDYIESPKEDGYRGVHLIYKYNSPHHPEHNGRRIEIQLRSRLMHCWATAVETVDTFTKQSLKTNQGKEDWKLFFKYMGSVFALAEKTPLVPGTPQNRADLRAEITRMNKDLKVDALLSTYQEASIVLDHEKRPKDARYFLLLRDSEARSVQFIGFRQEQLEDATQMYLDFEKQYKGQPKQAVLVSVDSITALKKAYPNYFGDTRAFLHHLRLFIGTIHGHLRQSLATVPPPTVPPPTVPPPTSPPPTVPPPTVP
jgi:ppGpp synthetase/RelA/SpoT-type nucleotidyltranferase